MNQIDLLQTYVRHFRRQMRKIMRHQKREQKHTVYRINGLNGARAVARRLKQRRAR